MKLTIITSALLLAVACSSPSPDGIDPSATTLDEPEDQSEPVEEDEDDTEISDGAVDDETVDNECPHPRFDYTITWDRSSGECVYTDDDGNQLDRDEGFPEPCDCDPPRAWYMANPSGFSGSHGTLRYACFEQPEDEHGQPDRTFLDYGPCGNST